MLLKFVSDTKSLYTWNQTTSDLCVHLTIPDGLSKANLSVDITGTRLEVVIKNGVEMIQGDLHARVDVDGSTWTLDGRRYISAKPVHCNY